MDTLTNTSSLFDFCEQYVQRGFGSMNKTEFEFFIFRQLLLNPKYQNKSNYELSIDLRIPETKVKRLRYEVDLRFPKEEEDKREEVKKILEHAKLRIKEKKIEFLVEDVSLQKYIAYTLKKDGRFSDSSFNSELILIHFEDFYYLLEKVYEAKELEKATNELQQLLTANKLLAQKEKNNKATIWERALTSIAKGVTQGVLSTPTGITIESIIKLAKMIKDFLN